MRRYIYFGASKILKRYFENIPKDVYVVAIADNNYEKLQCFCGHKVICPLEILEYEFDYVLISLDDLKTGNENEIIHIYNQLIEMGVPDEKIILQSFKYDFEHPSHKPRTNFIRDLSTYFKSIHLEGAIAECGIYRGWFSGILAEIFPDSKLYLFDSFEGFSQKDTLLEKDRAKSWLEGGAQHRLSNTNEEIVRLRIRNRDRLKIKPGFIPDTLEGIDDEFAFVNLDMDLYNPQLQALKYFSKHMCVGGVILLHDYFSAILDGSRRAVEDFEGISEFSVLPIGDTLSIALIKK